MTLEPCPFCGVPLTIRTGANPYGRCDTDDCWMSERKMTVVLQDAHQVEQWNRRPNQTRTGEPDGYQF